jgi:glutathione synthase/RimK-type ligase-like ATP-grasp enzyme
VTLAAAGALTADVAGVDLLVAPDADVVVLEVNRIPGWQALQSVGDQDLAQLVSACEALAARV